MKNSPEENKAIVRRFSNEFKNKANHNIVDELCTPNFTHHFKDPRVGPGREGMKNIGRMVVKAFPDVHVTIEDMIAEGNRAVERSSVKATHNGDFLGIPATGKPVRWTETHVYKLDNGKIEELWSEIDFLSIMMQIGAIPAQ